MTPMEILSFLQTKTKDRLSINKVALFGRALHKLGISSRRKTRGTEYHVVKRIILPINLLLLSVCAIFAFQIKKI